MSVYHLLLLLSLGEISAASNERNSNETFIECGLGYRNCSQKLRRFDCDNELFNCSVGGKDEIKTFENTISLSKGCNVRFDAPELLGISSDCLKNSAINQRQTIEITFRLPKAFFCNKSDEDQSQHVGHYQFPKAIYLNLSRVREEDYSDPWSFTCPGERIFIFHKYSPRLNYDAGSPRNLTYRHRLGLNLSNQSYSYILNLTTAEASIF
ncbi:uncharacterized protein LOC127831200 [Dreissena polymorpha]|uniref:uncharacterized protein LOC127831200 n=1 Tax=Dreissena polymorpha TaxID=45954 RepID=UPI0022656A86|nr:uncharacterized protein LOC127831200 [Dreissena polymorpha]